MTDSNPRAHETRHVAVLKKNGQWGIRTGVDSVRYLCNISNPVKTLFVENDEKYVFKSCSFVDYLVFKTLFWQHWEKRFKISTFLNTVKRVFFKDSELMGSKLGFNWNQLRVWTRLKPRNNSELRFWGFTVRTVFHKNSELLVFRHCWNTERISDKSLFLYWKITVIRDAPQNCKTLLKHG